MAQRLAAGRVILTLIVTQTLVELVGMVILVRLVPRLMRHSPAVIGRR